MRILVRKKKTKKRSSVDERFLSGNFERFRR